MKFVANPVVVDAFKIVRVEDLTELRLAKSVHLRLDDGSSIERTADSSMVARYVPVEGDYWVIQEDGYEYVNPKAVFERKYTRGDDNLGKEKE